MGCKYQQIAETLKARIAEGVYPPDSMLPTEFQLCEQYGVSRQTIRMALKTLADQNIIQRRQGSGSRVLNLSDAPAERRKTVAIITTYISDYIFPAILREAEAVLSANNCSTLLFATSNQLFNERRILLNLLQETHIDGILVEGTKSALPNPNLDLYQKLRERKIPLVFFNGSYDNLDAVSVLDDNFDGGRQLTRYLAGKGHRIIAGIFKSDDIQGHQRFAGFSSAMCEENLPLEDRHVFWYRTEDKPELTPDSKLWDHALAPVLEGCSAVVCYNDEVASYVIQCLTRRGVSVPGQMAVVSFDNSLYSRLTVPRITSLSHGDLNAGRVAAETLLALFRGEAPESRLLPWTLEEKESS